MACEGSYEKSEESDQVLIDAMKRVADRLPKGSGAASSSAAADGAPATEAAAAAGCGSDAAANSSNASSGSSSSTLGNRGDSAFRLFEELSGSLKADTLPLHRAVAYGHKLVVELLLTANADPNLRCCHGYSPLLQVGAAIISLLVTQLTPTGHLSGCSCAVPVLIKSALPPSYSF
jgi:hypothetical protein